MENKLKEKIGIFIFIIIALVYFPFVFISYSTQIIDEHIRVTFQNISYVSTVIFAVTMGIYSVKKYDIKNKFGITFLLFVFGYLSYLCSELLWIICEYLGLPPLQFLNNLVLVLTYILFTAGTLLAQKEGEVGWTPARIIMSLVAMLVISLFTLYVSMNFFYDPAIGIKENIINVFYGSTDTFIVISMILLINLSFSVVDKIYRKSWILFALAFLINWTGDMAYIPFHAFYDDYHWLYRQLDYFWIASYLFVAYAFYTITKIKQKMESS